MILEGCDYLFFLNVMNNQYMHACLYVRMSPRKMIASVSGVRQSRVRCFYRKANLQETTPMHHAPCTPHQFSPLGSIIRGHFVGGPIHIPPTKGRRPRSHRLRHLGMGTSTKLLDIDHQIPQDTGLNVVGGSMAMFMTSMIFPSHRPTIDASPLLLPWESF